MAEGGRRALPHEGPPPGAGAGRGPFPPPCRGGRARGGVLLAALVLATGPVFAQGAGGGAAPGHFRTRGPGLEAGAAGGEGVPPVDGKAERRPDGARLQPDAARGRVRPVALGRLFMTVEERLRLDEARLRYATRPPEMVAEPAPAEPEPTPEPVVSAITVNGLVVRSSGRNVSWINGTPVFSGETTVEGIRVEPEGRGHRSAVRLILPSGTDTNPVKPGQRIDVARGQEYDALGHALQDARRGGTVEMRAVPVRHMVVPAVKMA